MTPAMAVSSSVNSSTWKKNLEKMMTVKVDAPCFIYKGVGTSVLKTGSVVESEKLPVHGLRAG